MEIQGKFNTQRFFDTLALILSERENAKITVKVTQREKKEEMAAAGQQTAAREEVTEGGRRNEGKRRCKVSKENCNAYPGRIRGNHIEI